jgi:NADPH:quinone reductase-like Zn-dependent oxidoreductase
MKAIILRGFGGVENLVISDINDPEMSDNEVIVRAKAIGINPIDIKTRKGKGMAAAFENIHPVILGWDISGVVTQTGKRVTLFKPGDEVFGMINFPGHGKTYAEFVSAPENHLALKPANVSHKETAAASLAALTAWQVLKYKMGLRQGARILIHSAAGGVGHYAVQMAKYLGAWVAGTSSGRNGNFVIELGADQHIDYENQKFEEELGDLDFVLDTIGGENTYRSFNVLRPGGTVICIPSGTSPDIREKAMVKGLTGDHFRVQSNGADMNEIASLLERGLVKSYISGTYSFDEIQAAHLQMETGKTKGKIVVIP